MVFSIIYGENVIGLDYVCRGVVVTVIFIFICNGIRRGGVFGN